MILAFNQLNSSESVPFAIILQLKYLWLTEFSSENQLLKYEISLELIMFALFVYFSFESLFSKETITFIVFVLKILFV